MDAWRRHFAFGRWAQSPRETGSHRASQRALTKGCWSRAGVCWPQGSLSGIRDHVPREGLLISHGRERKRPREETVRGDK